MGTRRTDSSLSLAVLVLVALAAGAPTPATSRSDAMRRAAAAGPCLERQTWVLGAPLRLAAASRALTTDTVRTSAALERAGAEVERLAAALAPPEGEGELARLNRAAGGGRFACSEELFGALEAAVALAAETDGACDPTDGPLRRLWRRRAGPGGPDPGELAAARPLVNWRLLALDPGDRTARLARAGMEVALESVLRGAILEHAARALRERGVARARLELGGDVLAFTNHDPWPVAVLEPGGGSRTVLTLILANGAVATSRSGPDGGEVLDPRTGRPAPEGVSVTVIERSALRARARAEALRVMGRERAAAHARAHGGIGVLWLEPAGEGWRAWAWNVGRMVPEPDARIEWLTVP